MVYMGLGVTKVISVGVSFHSITLELLGISLPEVLAGVDLVMFQSNPIPYHVVGLLSK